MWHLSQKGDMRTLSDGKRLGAPGCAPGFHCYFQRAQGPPEVDICGLVFSSDFFWGEGGIMYRLLSGGSWGPLVLTTQGF